MGENWDSDSGNWMLLYEWDVKSCTVIDIWWRFGTTCCLHLHGSSTLEIAPTDYSVTSIFLHQVTRCHIPEDHNLHIYCSDNLKTAPEFMICRYCIVKPKFHTRSEHFWEKGLQWNQWLNLIKVSSNTILQAFWFRWLSVSRLLFYIVTLCALVIGFGRFILKKNASNFFEMFVPVYQNTWRHIRSLSKILLL